MADETIFNLPNTPQEFGVVLPSPQLRRLDFSALDFTTLNRACIEYIRSYFPSDFNDFYANSGVMMLMELISYIGGNLAQRGDILIDEAFLSTCQTKEAVIQHLTLIDQTIKRATPAVVDVEISLQAPAQTEIRIAAGTKFLVPGPDGNQVTYEVFRAPGDFVSYVSIPPSKRGVVAYGIEGMFGTMIIVVSAGGSDQYVDITAANVLDEPIFVDVSTGSVSRSYVRVPIIEKYDSNDEVFEVRHHDGFSRIVFGNDVYGKSPLAGQVISVRYRLGGGIRGRIGANTINVTRPVTPQPPSSASVEALFRNPQPSSGGTDEESIDQAKRRAPRDFSTQQNAVTGEDYSLLAEGFSHPVYGSVAKAVAVLRTGVDQDLDTIVEQVRNAATDEDAKEILQDQFINRNIVELYVLAEGPGDVPVKPSAGMKTGLRTFFDDINVLTDEVRVYDGAIKSVDVEATIVVSRNVDAGTVRVQVEDVIRSFFSLRNFDMGTGLHISNLYDVIQDVPGVQFVRIFSPADDIIDSRKIGDPANPGVGFNEVIILGNLNLSFYYEQANFKVPPISKS